jgi:cell division septum initiation protein DivIVA
MMTNLKPEEQERLSYIQGNTKELALIYQSEETFLEENLDLDQEVRSLQKELMDLKELNNDLTYNQESVDELKYQHREDTINLIGHINYLERLLKKHDIEFESNVDIDF